MTLNRRYFWIGGLVLLAMVLITSFAAPSGSRHSNGSTYGRSPDGYGAWYGYMQQQGMPVQRWQKPLKALMGTAQPLIQQGKVQETGRARPLVEKLPDRLTLIRISDRANLYQGLNPTWVEQGNVLVLLGNRAPATKAPFDSRIPSPKGVIRIEGSRRQPAPEAETLLRDSFGAVVWQKSVGQGKIIYASTPYLGANAYQSTGGNFEFLTQLVSEPGYPIWVDEYLHGYKDLQEVKRETPNLLVYLSRTPIALGLIQAVVFLLILLWGQNCRFGQVLQIKPPMVNNSQAYMQAMAEVLRKAECSEFVLTTIARSEQLEIQKALGLGTELLPLETLEVAWSQHQRPVEELRRVLKPSSPHLRDPELQQWLQQVSNLRQQLPTLINS